MNPQFRLFGAAHLAILVTPAALGLAAAFFVRRKPELMNPARFIFALTASLLGLSWYLLRGAMLHSPWRWNLPLEVCDVAVWATAAALIWPQQLLLELSYYWGLAGASMALLTPYLIAPLTNPLSISFLAGHAIIVAAIVFLLATAKLRPRPGSWKFALIALNALALFDFFLDRRLGVNYMYLMYKPPIASLLSVMGSWPWYLFTSEFVAAAIFFALQWPFRKARNAA